MSATPETVPNGLWPEGRRNKQAGAPAIVASNPAESSGNGRVRQRVFNLHAQRSPHMLRERQEH